MDSEVAVGSVRLKDKGVTYQLVLHFYASGEIWMEATGVPWDDYSQYVGAPFSLDALNVMDDQLFHKRFWKWED